MREEVLRFAKRVWTDGYHDAAVDNTAAKLEAYGVPVHLVRDLNDRAGDDVWGNVDDTLITLMELAFRAS